MGTLVGLQEGVFVGDVGATVGFLVGNVGAKDGSTVGSLDGSIVPGSYGGVYGPV